MSNRPKIKKSGSHNDEDGRNFEGIGRDAGSYAQ